MVSLIKDIFHSKPKDKKPSHDNLGHTTQKNQTQAQKTSTQSTNIKSSPVTEYKPLTNKPIEPRPQGTTVNAKAEQVLRTQSKENVRPPQNLEKEEQVLGLMKALADKIIDNKEMLDDLQQYIAYYEDTQSSIPTSDQLYKDISSMVTTMKQLLAAGNRGEEVAERIKAIQSKVEAIDARIDNR